MIFCNFSFRMLERRRVTRVWSQPPETWNQLAEFKCELDAHCEVTLQKYMQCIGAPIQGSYFILSLIL